MRSTRPDLDTLLSELAAAERRSAPGDAAARIAARIARPPFVSRLPLAVAGALRQTTGLLQPAVAGGVAATFVGLALGTWLALASQRGVPEAQASDPYDYSSLVDDGASGLAASYLDASASDNTENSGDEPGAPTASGDSSGGAR